MIGESIESGVMSSTSFFGDVLIPLISSGIVIAILTLIVCAIVMPFAKKLIKYAIDEYNKHK